MFVACFHNTPMVIQPKAKPSLSHKPLQPAAYAVNEQIIVNAKQKEHYHHQRRWFIKFKLKNTCQG